MAIVGFNFTKINVERKQDSVKGKIDIQNNVAITDVQTTDLSIGSDAQKAVKIEFNFGVNYEPKLGTMKFVGDIIYLGAAAKIDELLKEWEKGKKLPKEIAGGVINTILTKCNIQALILSQQVNLPAPVQLPKVKVEEPKK